MDQDGTVYRGSNEPNLVFARGYRSYAAEYLQEVFRELGTDFLAVRVGGGKLNELTYPRVFAGGRWQNDYWAFDRNAQKEDPVAGWKPGDPANPSRARAFLTWYTDSLTNYQDWQIAMVRRYFPGEIAVLYGAYGVRSGEFAQAVADGLSGRSPAEENGEIQAGHSFARQLAAITDPRVAIWITWADNPSVVKWLAPLARLHHLEVWGENVGMNSAADLLRAVSLARRYLDGFMWVRASQAYCGCNGWATIADFSSAIGAAS